MAAFRLIPATKDYIWGGNRLREEYGKSSDSDRIAETWECSTHPDGPSVVADGPDAGKTLTEVLREHREYLGTGYHGPETGSEMMDGIPILIKFIDAKSDLSVQVHPDDAYAAEKENGQRGKTEMWYVVDAEPGASLVFGLSREMTKEKLRCRIEEGKLERYLNRVPVHRNDVFYIPSGTIHAIGKGVVIAEIQENSNLTYRLYDYGRLGKDGLPRALHIDKAIDVSDLMPAQEPRQPMRILRYTPGCAREVLGTCQYFSVERWIVRTETGVDLPPLPESFRNILCLKGKGAIGGLTIRKGDSIFVPATTEILSVTGEMEFLVTRI